MTDAEKYLFDLNGYIVVEGLLTPDEVAAAVVDHNRLDRPLVVLIRSAFEGEGEESRPVARQDHHGHERQRRRR